MDRVSHMNKFVLIPVSLVMAMRAFGGDTMIDLDLPNLREPQQNRIVSCSANW